MKTAVITLLSIVALSRAFPSFANVPDPAPTPIAVPEGLSRKGGVTSAGGDGYKFEKVTCVYSGWTFSRKFKQNDMNPSEHCQLSVTMVDCFSRAFDLSDAEGYVLDAEMLFDACSAEESVSAGERSPNSQ